MKNHVFPSCSAACRFLLICLVVAVPIGPGPVLAQAPAPALTIDRTQLEARLNAVGTLIETSSGAKQIEANGDPGARAKREQAREAYRAAQAAFQAGDDAKAQRLVVEASSRMFEAVRLAGAGELSDRKAQDDFSVRLESVKALLDAQRRIGAEKRDAPGAAEAVKTVESLLGEAESLSRSDVTRARAKLEQAYLVARASIGSMRSGDTLVRSLEFSSKEEEYRYEIDRNDTHQLLIRVLLQEKGERPEAVALMDKARQLRVQAEAAAAGGDHAGAIGLLEDSTRELVRAIRGAGIYIPG